MGRDNVVGIVTHYVLDGPVVESRGGGKKFSAPLQTGSRTHPAPYTIDNESFLWLKRPGIGFDHLPPSSLRGLFQDELCL